MIDIGSLYFSWKQRGPSTCIQVIWAASRRPSAKKERVKKQIYKNRDLATKDIADYIDSFYNRISRHSHLGGLSPEQFESAQKPR